MDNWNFYEEGESPRNFLARFLIAVDELRARLNPGVYPNLEISDEGHVWFNMPSPLGLLEVFAFPYEFEYFSAPGLALSLPHNPENTKVDLAEIFCEIAINSSDMHVFAAYASAQETIKAYSENKLPELHFLKGKREISDYRDEVDFFNYSGLWFSVKERNVLSVEIFIKEVLSYIEKSVE